MDYGDLPIGFGTALLQNEKAMKKFEMLSESQKQAVINKTRKINSKNEMKCFVSSFSEGSVVI